MIARGIAAFLGFFALLNCIGGLFFHGFDANIWWVHASLIPQWAGGTLLFVVGTVLLAYAMGCLKNEVLRGSGISVVIVISFFTLANSVEFFSLSARHQIRPWVPIPLSAIVTLTLIWIVTRIYRDRTSAKVSPRLVFAGIATAAAMVVAFPLAQMFFFGTTDYRRKADVVVVLGARAYADGTASQALTDRVRSAVDLYHQGLVTHLIFSGGPGDGATSEPQAMRHIAMKFGVPESAIVLDEEGLNTDATVKNTTAAFPKLNARRVLVVSHAYHLPRVKLAYQRAGWDVRTVPARQSRRLRNEPIYIAREVVALWAYYVKPITS